MPQLDFGNPLTFAQVVWMFVIFAALYAALSGWALPNLGGVLAMRRDRIATDLDNAKQAKAAADAAADEVRERSRSAAAEAQNELARASAAAKAEAAERTRVDTEALDRQLDEAERRIAAARTQAMGALRQVAGDTAGAVLARLTGHAVDPGRVDAAVGDVMGNAGAARS